MSYKLKITAGRSAGVGWMMKPDGSFMRQNNGIELVFVVDSPYKDRISSDELLKQTGNKWKPGIGKPDTIMNANGWKVEVI
ncbi:MAG: hypothetical protein J5711_04375 [Bacteroidales bacterium]|nr:hypothetical protein [Bacteroidales bacterium]